MLKVTFSTVAAEDLWRGLRKLLIFEPAEFYKGPTANAEAEIADLHSRIKKVYARVNMDVRLPFDRLTEYLIVDDP